MIKLFTAPWCVNCKPVKNRLGVLGEEGIDYEILSVDLDENKDLVEEYNVRGIPCLIKDGKTYVGMPNCLVALSED